MKHAIRIVAAGLLLCLHSHAQPANQLSFASYPGPVAPAGVSNTPLSVQCDAATAPQPVTLTYDSSDTQAYTGGAVGQMDGAAYVTVQQGSGAAAGACVYSSKYTGNLSGWTGSVDLMADDVATVSINGKQIGATTPEQYNTVVHFAVPAGVYVDGVNTIAVAVTNISGYTGVGFKATATPPALAACALPSVQVVNPKLPAAPANCALPTGAVRVGADGDQVQVMYVAAPVHLIYCAGGVCNAPVMYWTTPIKVGPNAMLGGAPVAGSTAAGALYVISGVREMTLAVTPAGGVLQPPVTVAAKP